MTAAAVWLILCALLILTCAAASRIARRKAQR